ncbi:hypothetical protein NM208_g3760 [Fusarium decemcellulare]|uniref:Uncharacterized protein n=1 Tax=Fusarium decemcellulare TaxID=57161 RepID=A0ACC1SMZ5_9HYPO|nr:hypothetical protein NM208_g3760 [Fusarium decemcellulare]
MVYFSPRQIAGIVTGALALVDAKSWKDFKPQNRIPSSCPDYVDYSQKPHAPFSSGKLKLSFMRPKEECRTFKSPAVEKVIKDIKARVKDPDLGRLFENTFPSTLDTTVKYFDKGENLAFIVTGDITAQWLRDTGNQFAHLYKLLPQDKNLQALVKAVINTEARYISEYPYCGSFQPPPESGLAPTVNDYATLVNVNPPVDNQTVFECKYELDSLAGFLKIVRSYYANTKDSSFINDNFKSAMDQILRVIDEQSQSTWADDWTYVSYYNWTGVAGSLSPPVPNGGNGEPKLANGLVACSHRPSDDLSVFNYITSDNAMMSVELGNVAGVLEKVGSLKSLSRKLRSHAKTIRQAVMDHTLTANGIFAYETNGYGGQYIMDDANVPSLVSLPYLGFLKRDDATYKKTKKALFSRANPYYAVGETFSGIGGPHVNATYPWPMSQVSAIYGTDDDKEIAQRLKLIMENTSGLGLIHESVSIYNSTEFTRPWFAWANSYFAEMVLDLAERKPGLIFKNDKPISVRKAVEAFTQRVRQLESFIASHNLDIPSCSDDCRHVLDELITAYAPNASTPSTQAHSAPDAIDGAHLASGINLTTPPSEAAPDQCPPPDDRHAAQLDTASLHLGRATLGNGTHDLSLQHSSDGFLQFYGPIDADWVWDASSVLQIDGQVPFRASLPPLGLDEMFPHQNLQENSVAVEDESTDDEEHSEVTNQFSSRLGNLITTDSGDMRFYGATSNLSLISSDATPKEFNSVIKPCARQQSRLDALGIGHVVEDDLTHHLINLYFAWHDPSLHVVDRVSFEHARAEYHENGTDSSLYSEVLINAMCAVGAGFGTRNHPDYPAPLGEFFANRAKALLDLEIDHPKVATVQSLAILSSYEAAQTRDSRGWLFSGMSIRLALDMGLHLSAASYVENGSMTELEAHARKVTFWACFVTDRMWGLYLGRPFDNSFDAVTVEKPHTSLDRHPQDFWLAYAPIKPGLSSTSLPDHQELVTERYINLYEIMGVLGHYLYFRADASNIELQALAHQTNQRLIEWKSRLPPQLEVDVDAGPNVSYLPHSLMLHMQYSLFVITLHRPFVAKHYIQPEPPVGPGHLHAREMCIRSAVEIAKFLRMFERQFSLQRSNVQMVYITFTAALILVYATLAENNHESHRNLSTHLATCSHALAELGNIFPNANRTLDVLLKVKRSWQARLVAATIGSKRRASSTTTGSSSKRRRAQVSVGNCEP